MFKSSEREFKGHAGISVVTQMDAGSYFILLQGMEQLVILALSEP